MSILKVSALTPSSSLQGDEVLLGVQGGESVKVPVTMLQMVNSGPTGARPQGELRTGRQFFDEALGRPIWWNGSAWVDATGTTV